MPRVKLGDVEIYYRDSGGEGTPIVLLHGFPFDSELWDPQFEAFAKKYRLIAPDLRGYGESSSADEYSMGAFADDVAGLLDRLGVERAIVGGLSMGGYIAFEFLRRHHGRVAGLILADTRPDADTPEAFARRESQQERIRKEGPRALIDGMADVLLSEETRARRPEVVEKLKGIMKQEDAAWLGGLEAMKQRPDSTGELGTIDVPTLTVVGEHDKLAPVDVVRSMHESIVGSELVVIESAGHITNLEAPAAFNAALDDFLSRL